MQPSGHYQKHQNPMLFVIIFAGFALIALVLILASNTPKDTGSGGTPGPDTAYMCPQGAPDGFELSDVEGQTIEDVKSWAVGKGYTVRVVAEDGQSFPQTMDYNPNRVNTQVDAGVVTRYCGNF